MLQLKILISQEVKAKDHNKSLYKVAFDFGRHMHEIVLLPFKLVDSIVVESNQEQDIWHKQISDYHFANGWPLILQDCLNVFHVKDADFI